VKAHAPAAARNREPILAVLREVLPPRARVLEVGSGTGQHAAHFAAALPEITWQPTDVSEDALESIAAWRAEVELGNLHPPRRVDVSVPGWCRDAEVVVCINVVHIAPWSVSEGLFEGASAGLPADGVLFLYGPYRFDGAFTAPSNEEFDRSLRARDATWGVRDVRDLDAVGARVGFARVRTEPLPANNHVLVYRRAG
jgi:SAM-dependent methyltransferase